MASIVQMQNRIANMAEKAKLPMIRTVAGIVGMGGAATSGFLRGMGYEKLPGTDVDTDLVIGGLAMGAGVAGFGGRQTSALSLAFGIGMAAPGFSRIVESATRDWRAKR